MKFLTVLGARPQFVKAAPLSVALRHEHTEVLVHTGQHYDRMMSDVFFDELALPPPDHHLGVGSGSHGAQTGAMLAAVEAVLEKESPDAVVVYGDTNSTLAGALAAVKLGIPVAHVEAGLRSFNRGMPEEINRVVTDHVATWLFAPSEAARMHLAAEGVTVGVHVVGDVMLDAIRLVRERSLSASLVLTALGLDAGAYALATVHRAENTDDAVRLRSIMAGLETVELSVVLPAHPRTRRRLDEFGISVGSNVRIVEPLGYLDMLALEAAAAMILTDSGGVQKEAYYFGVPCITLRDETEWVETVSLGWNVLAGTDPDRIVAATRRRPPVERPPLYGNGRAAERIVEILTAKRAR